MSNKYEKGLDLLGELLEKLENITSIVGAKHVGYVDAGVQKVVEERDALKAALNELVEATSTDNFGNALKAVRAAFGGTTEKFAALPSCFSIAPAHWAKELGDEQKADAKLAKLRPWLNQIFERKDDFGDSFSEIIHGYYQWSYSSFSDAVLTTVREDLLDHQERVEPKESSELTPDQVYMLEMRLASSQAKHLVPGQQLQPEG